MEESSRVIRFLRSVTLRLADLAERQNAFTRKLLKSVPPPKPGGFVDRVNKHGEEILAEDKKKIEEIKKEYE